MATPPRSSHGIMLVDDHPAVREALAQLLAENGLTVGAQAAGRDEALRLVGFETPGLALVDLSMGQDEGLALVADLHTLGIPVVVCSTHEEPAYVRRALDAGARAYVAKRDAGRALVRTVRDVLNGWMLISPRAADDLGSGA
jgi:DNA-binding NarL/FixJ family response regulator